MATAAALPQRISTAPPALIWFPASRQLTMEKDAEIIANYSNPTWVLGGWTPAMAPLILTQPGTVTAASGETVTFSPTVAGIPRPALRWRKNGVTIPGATTATLELQKVKAGDAGSYAVTATNTSASATSRAAALSVR